MNSKTAAILSIGNEILKGRTVNTNASEIARKLSFSGYTVKKIIVVQDEPSEIAWGFQTLIGKHDLVISTGGLGPTFDDMTVESFATAFGYKLVEDPASLQILKERYEKAGVELTPERKKMIMIPEGATALKNPFGAAIGVMLEREGSRIIILPGVPKECMGIIDHVLPSIKVAGISTVERSMTISGVMESSIAPIVNKVMKMMEKQVYVKTHPLRSETRNPMLEIEVTAMSQNDATAKESAERAFKLIFDGISEAGLHFQFEEA